MDALFTTKALRVYASPISGLCRSYRVRVAGRRSKRWQAGFLALFVLTAGGCQVFEKRQPPESASSAEQPESPPEPVADDDLSTAIAHLERGEEQRARALLVCLREKRPDSAIVGQLLRQIDAPVDELLPGPYRQVEVGPGDSLSSIAARELGDPMLFYALARLNGIATPARIPAGTLLRIPASDERRSDTPVEPSSPEAIPAQEIESVAIHLARSGHGEQARKILTEHMTKNAQRPVSTQRLVVDITLEQVSEARTVGEVDRALAVVEEVLPVIDAPRWRTRLVQARAELRSSELFRLARQLRERGDLQGAYSTAAEAAELDPASKEAQRLAKAVKEELIDSLHGKALVAWRNRNVDLAIRNWETLLDIAPDFEPARIYLERARSLRLRLGEP